MADASTTGGDRFYLPQLDGIRFFAFLLVFFSHFQWAPDSLARVPFVGPLLIGFHRHGGWGVDLFLVLSAYLITTLLLIENRRRGRISLKFFYIRRTLRIWPLYYFILLIMMFLLPLAQGTYDSQAHQDVLRTHGVASTFFLGNLSELVTSVPVPDNIGHLWTISLEEQFYLMWPAILVAVLGRPKLMYGFLWGTLLLSATVRALCVNGVVDVVIWKNTVTHFDPFATGSLLALWRFEKSGNERWAPVKFLVGVGLILLTTEFPRPRVESIHVVWQYLAVAVGFTMIIDASLSSGRIVARAFSQQPFVWLGQITYGLYIYHLLGIEAGDKIASDLLGASLDTTRGWAVHCAVSLSATVLFAHLSFRWLERPFMKLKKRFAFVASRDT